MSHSTIVVYILCLLIRSGLQCSKSRCTQGRICMQEPPTGFVNSNVQVCCNVSQSLAGLPVFFRCLGQRQTVQTTVESPEVCSTLSVTSPKNKGTLCFCQIENQTACQDSHLIFSEISIPESLSVQCYTQFPDLVCHWWPVLDFQVKQRNVTVTLLWDVLHCNSSGLVSTVCSTRCTLDLIAAYILQNDCWMNVSVVITYHQRPPHLSRSMSSPWLELNPSTLEKLQPYNFRITNITSTCITLQWSINISDYFEKRTLTHITLDSKWKKVKINKTEYDHRSETVCSLTPFTRYNISLVTRLEQGTVWSDTITATAVTQADVPLCGPAVTPGGYNIIKTDQKHYAVVYWKAPSERDWQGDSGLGFNVYIEHRHSKQQTIMFDEETFYAEVPLTEPDLTSVYVKSRNSIGEVDCQVNVLKLTAAKKAPPVSNVYSTWMDGSVQVSWVFQNQGSYKVTVFWCQRSNKTDICNTPVNWKEQGDLRQKLMKLELPLVEAQQFQYGVSVTDNVTGEVSEVIWTSCFKSYQDGKELQFGLCSFTTDKGDNVTTLAALLSLFIGFLFIIGFVILGLSCYRRRERFKDLFDSDASQTLNNDSTTSAESDTASSPATSHETVSGDTGSRLLVSQNISPQGSTTGSRWEEYVRVDLENDHSLHSTEVRIVTAESGLDTDSSTEISRLPVPRNNSQQGSPTGSNWDGHVRPRIRSDHSLQPNEIMSVGGEASLDQNMMYTSWSEGNMHTTYTERTHPVMLDNFQDSNFQGSYFLNSNFQGSNFMDSGYVDRWP